MSNPTNINTGKYSLPIDVLELIPRAYHILKRANINTIGDIIRNGENGLANIKQIGPILQDNIVDQVSSYLCIPKENLFGNTLSNDVDTSNVGLDQLPIVVLKLSARVNNILTEVGINNISQLLELQAQGYPNITNIGKETKHKINTTLSELLGSQFISQMDKRPYVYSVDTQTKVNLIKIIAPFSQSLLKQFGYLRDYEMLKRRFGLEGSDVYTLQDLGDYFNIERERVRQIVQRAKLKIYNALLGRVESKHWRVPEQIVDEAKNVFSLLKSNRPVLTENEIIDILQKYYKCIIKENDMGAVKLLLNLDGWENLPKTAPQIIGINILPAWYLPTDLDRSTLFRLINIIYHNLLNAMVSISQFDLMIDVNRKTKKKVEPIYFEAASKICYAIEKI